MNIKTTPALLTSTPGEAVAALIYEDSRTIEPALRSYDKSLGVIIQKALKKTAFKAAAGETLVLSEPSSGRPIILLGLGKKADFNEEKFRTAASSLPGILKKYNCKSLIFPISNSQAQALDQVSDLVVSLRLANYKFSIYKKTDKGEKAFELSELTLISPKKIREQIIKQAKRAEVVADGINYVRDLANHPGNVMTPDSLAEEAKKLAKKTKISCKILEKPELVKLGMEALLAVNQGSALPPKFVILEYAGKKSQSPIVLIGKGITFDSGGISLKPGKSMDEMKFDMCGGATVLGVIKIASELRLPLHLVGLVPATENLPSGTASRPGDIVKAMSGKTIEIINTDAEGRMILADALAYAGRYKPTMVIDFATLTGAAVVALGTDYAAAFSNRQKLMDDLKKAAEKSGEKIWPLPLPEEYKEQIKSSVADIKNVGNEGQGAGTIVGALFLQEFVSYPWIHLDIAGTAWTTIDKPYRPKGATGYGIRLMLEFLK